MSGAFGLLGDPHPAHFPLDRLVENRARLDAHKLNRLGAFVEGRSLGSLGAKIPTSSPDTPRTFWSTGTPFW